MTFIICEVTASLSIISMISDCCICHIGNESMNDFGKVIPMANKSKTYSGKY